MKLNWRHKAGLFLTLVAVGCTLFLECSAKQAAGIALLGISFAWLIGSLTPRILVVTFAILVCAVALYVAVAPVWGDWNSVRNSAAQYDSATADLQSAVKGALFVVSSDPIPPGATIGAPQNGAKPKKPTTTIDWSTFVPLRGAAQETHQSVGVVDGKEPTRSVDVPEAVKKWIRPEQKTLDPDWSSKTLVVDFPRTMAEADFMRAVENSFLVPRPTFSFATALRAHAWNVFGGLALFISGLSVLGLLFLRTRVRNPLSVRGALSFQISPPANERPVCPEEH